MAAYGTEGTFRLRLPMSAHWALPDVSRTCPYRRVCEGFRMPAADERCGRHRRPASENLQGRKPREGNVWSCGVLYGDLSVADEAWEWWRGDRAHGSAALGRTSSWLWLCAPTLNDEDRSN